MNSRNEGKARPGTIAELEALAESLGVAVAASEDVSVLAEPVRVGDLAAPNSLAVHPMEGCDGDADGRPGELTLRRYERFAAGGAGLIWAEAIAVVPEGRANPRQLWLNEKSAAAFADLVRPIRKTAADRFGRGHRPLLVAQLTHSGRYSRPRAMIARHDPYLDAHMKLPADLPVVTDECLDGLYDAYAAAARLAFEAGFDAVDVKACHGYLVAELLAGCTREGRYGGAFEGRVRFFLGVIDRIRGALGPGAAIATRLGLFDAIPHPYGWGVDTHDHTTPDLAEPMKLVGMLAERNVRLINVTVGDPHYNPPYGKPSNEQLAGGRASPEHPLVGVARLIRLAGEVQKAHPAAAVVGTGYSWLGPLMPQVAAACKKAGLAKFIGAGRMAFAYPDFAADIVRKGRLDAGKVCIACGGCSRLLAAAEPTGCVVRDKKVYRPASRKGVGEKSPDIDAGRACT